MDIQFKITVPHPRGAETGSRTPGVRNGLTLVEIELETGRSHQIRVQCAAKGFPVAGDPKYGKKDDATFSRPALHSFRITFPHPMTGKIQSFLAPLPTDLELPTPAAQVPLYAGTYAVGVGLKQLIDS